jgi:hypothetical protein
VDHRRGVERGDLVARQEQRRDEAEPHEDRADQEDRAESAADLTEAPVDECLELLERQVEPDSEAREGSLVVADEGTSTNKDIRLRLPVGVGQTTASSGQTRASSAAIS